VQSDLRAFDELDNGLAAEDPVNGGRLAVLPSGESVITPPAQFRMLLISILAAGIGIVTGCIAFLLYKLIGLLTNLFFFHRFATDFSSARYNHLGLWVIVMPVIGGIVIGFIAKYGSPKIKGHGIPEAMEAVLATAVVSSPELHC
jgi:H+/Cl- antiporter ClcA